MQGTMTMTQEEIMLGNAAFTSKLNVIPNRWLVSPHIKLFTYTDTITGKERYPLRAALFFFVQERWRQLDMRKCKDDEAKGVQDAIYF